MFYVMLCFFFMFLVYLFFHVFEELVDSIVDNFFFSVKSVKHIKHSGSNTENRFINSS